jgi:hypothetical protein
MKGISAVSFTISIDITTVTRFLHTVSHESCKSSVTPSLPIYVSSPHFSSPRSKCQSNTSYGRTNHKKVIHSFNSMPRIPKFLAIGIGLFRLRVVGNPGNLPPDQVNF